MNRVTILQELMDKVDEMKNRISDQEYLSFCDSLQKLNVNDTSSESRSSASSATDCSAQRTVQDSHSTDCSAHGMVDVFDIHTQRTERMRDQNTNTYLLCPHCKTATERISGCSTVLCGVCKNQFIFSASRESINDPIPTATLYSHYFQAPQPPLQPQYSTNHVTNTSHKPYNIRGCNARMANGGICSYTGRPEYNSKCGKHVQSKYVRQDEATYNAYYAL